MPDPLDAILDPKAEAKPESETNVVPLKKDAMDPKQVKLWLNRCRTVVKFHRGQMLEKYKKAKLRYNSEAFGFSKIKNKYTHESFDFLQKDIEDFNGSVYFKNPTIDLSARDTENPQEVTAIENLEQIVNDDVKDNRSLKGLIRTLLVDEGLASIGAVYLDYDYKTKDTEELIDPNVPDQFKQEEISNKVRPCRIFPENLIRPPFQTLYNYQESPYLGYVDIPNLETLKNDPTLNPDVVSKVKGHSYKELADVDLERVKTDSKDQNDDLQFAKTYTVFIKGNDGGPIKRLVLADQDDIKEPLAYADCDNEYGPDNRGYGIHIVALNDPCEGFCPPSEAWKLESILCVIDYLLSKMIKHLKRSRTRVLVKGGKEGIKKENISKYLGADDLELIVMHDLPPGLNIQNLVEQIQDVALSADHTAMFELAKRVFDELSRKPAFAQVAVQEKDKTATETQAIQQQDTSQGAYKVDKFKDFLIGFFYDWAKLTQKNMKGVRNISVQNSETGQMEPREVINSEERNDMAGEFKLPDINIDSFVQPNKELKRKRTIETIQSLQALDPMLKQVGKAINPQRCVQEIVSNIDMRDPEGFLMDVPLRTVDQQIIDLVTKAQPMNPMDLKGNYQDALKRGAQLFQDDTAVGVNQQAGTIGRLEELAPGIGAPNGPLANFLKDLEILIEQQKQGQQKASGAGSDMRLNASEMAGAQG